MYRTVEKKSLLMHMRPCSGRSCTRVSSAYYGKRPQRRNALSPAPSRVHIRGESARHVRLEPRPAPTRWVSVGLKVGLRGSTTPNVGRSEGRSGCKGQSSNPPAVASKPAAGGWGGAATGWKAAKPPEGGSCIETCLGFGLGLGGFGLGLGLGLRLGLGLEDAEHALG